MIPKVKIFLFIFDDINLVYFRNHKNNFLNIHIPGSSADLAAVFEKFNLAVFVAIKPFLTEISNLCYRLVLVS